MKSTRLKICDVYPCGFRQLPAAWWRWSTTSWRSTSECKPSKY